MLSNLIQKDLPVNPRERRIIAWAAGFGAVLLIVDQITKILAAHYLRGNHIPIIPNVFDLVYVTNKGAAWGIMQGQVWFLLAIGILVAGAALCFMRWLTEGRTERYWALFIVLSGIVGNSIDRVWRGEVIDFLDFYYRNSAGREFHFPAFNVADTAICVGLGIYFLSAILHPSGEKARKRQEPATVPAVDHE
jgi:signal peptidase II